MTKYSSEMMVFVYQTTRCHNPEQLKHSQTLHLQGMLVPSLKRINFGRLSKKRGKKLKLK